MSQSTIDRVADNAWLKAVERIAIPFIGLLLWNQWNIIEDLQRKLPTVELRISQIEGAQKSASELTISAGADRVKFQRDITTELATLSAELVHVKETVQELKIIIRELTALLGKQKDSMLLTPESKL